MRTAVAVFSKTPGISPIKTRLATDIGHTKAEECFKLCLNIIKEVILDAQNITKSELIPYWAVAEKEAVNLPCWTNFKVIHTGDGSLGQRLSNVYDTLLNKYDYVILLGADSPQITATHILNSIDILDQNSSFAIGPTFDGGFYLFAGKVAIEKTSWLKVSYSVDTTLTQLTQHLAKFGTIKKLKTLTDIDYYDDLVYLKQIKVSSSLPSKMAFSNWLQMQ